MHRRLVFWTIALLALPMAGCGSIAQSIFVAQSSGAAEQVRTAMVNAFVDLLPFSDDSDPDE